MSLCLISAAQCALLLLPFSFLVEIDILLNCVKLFCEFGAFMYFRWAAPDRPRPFAMPWGWFGAWLITIPKVRTIA